MIAKNCTLFFFICMYVNLLAVPCHLVTVKQVDIFYRRKRTKWPFFCFFYQQLIITLSWNVARTKLTQSSCPSRSGSFFLARLQPNWVIHRWYGCFYVMVAGSTPAAIRNSACFCQIDCLSYSSPMYKLPICSLLSLSTYCLYSVCSEE